MGGSKDQNPAYLGWQYLSKTKERPVRSFFGFTIWRGSIEMNEFVRLITEKGFALLVRSETYPELIAEGWREVLHGIESPNNDFYLYTTCRHQISSAGWGQSVRTIFLLLKKAKPSNV